MSTQLRCYFVTKCNFVNPNPTGAHALDIKQVSDKKFLEKATENTLEIYQRIVTNALERSGPVIEIYDIENSNQKRLVIGYK
jgi:glutamate dehydrogenase